MEVYKHLLSSSFYRKRMQGIKRALKGGSHWPRGRVGRMVVWGLVGGLN
jgi:hypothetical protein